MRHSGVRASVRGLGHHDHVCVPYADDEDLRREINDFLNDGRRLGQRLLYVGSKTEDGLRDDLASFADAPRLFADGALQVASLENIYEPGKPIDADARLEVYARATEDALKEGFTGLRVAAEGTALVTDSATWDAHVHWESVPDRLATELPLSAMCCYDRRVLPKPILSDVARVHPALRASSSIASFRLYAGEQRHTLMLGGEVDYFSADDLDRLLELALPADGRTVLDLSELGFIDQHGLARIARRAVDPRDGSLRVRNAPAVTRRLGELIGVAV